MQFEPSGGIDQRRKKTELIRSSERLLFVCTQPSLRSLMEEDIEEAKCLGRDISIYEFSEPEDSREWIAFLQLIDDKRPVILFYGEDGFLHCLGLKCDAIVHAVPSLYQTRAMTNQFGFDKGCVVYIPAGFDITKWVPLKEKSRLTYWQLAKLWEVYGDEIYTDSPEELYRKYPQYFLNIYENGAKCLEAEVGYPLRIEWPENSYTADGKDKQVQTNLGNTMQEYDRLRDQVISGYLNLHENLSYYSTYFDEALEETEIVWKDDEQLPGIMVQAVKVRKADDSGVINCEQYSTVREMLARNNQGKELKLLSNFLFFLTPKLSRLYNDLRLDRPSEQISFDKMHLDYMLYEDNGKRVESFPLFRKACIAMKQNGQFQFFNFRLGGGKLSVGDFSVHWKAEDVDADDDRPIKIYTPYFSVPDYLSETKTYRKVVGEKRINLIIVQDRIICVRDGDVVLPSIGVVVSLSREIGMKFLNKNGLVISENGYFHSKDLTLNIELDAPAEMPESEWKQIKWAYGGGLSLILDGKGLCDGEEDTEYMMNWLQEEGWMSPLSCQTQESKLHKLVKHPRTAIGVTEDGSLVIIVYSGRTKRSTGADYREMIAIARKLFPDIRDLMNVDGGGSAMLGMAIDGNFMELSYPATSTESVAGMVRPINTVLSLSFYGGNDR